MGTNEESARGNGACMSAVLQGLDMLPFLLCPETFLSGVPAWDLCIL